MKKFLVAAIFVIALFTAQSVNGQTVSDDKTCTKTTIGGTVGIESVNVTAKVEETECENKKTGEVTVTTKGTAGISTSVGGYKKSTENTKTYKDKDEKANEDFQKLQEQIKDKRSIMNRMP